MVVHTTMQRRSRLARAIAGTEYSVGTYNRRDLTSEEKKICRHMSWEGKSVAEMAKAINWDQTVKSLYTKLVKINIKPRRSVSHKSP